MKIWSILQHYIDNTNQYSLGNMQPSCMTNTLALSLSYDNDELAKNGQARTSTYAFSGYTIRKYLLLGIELITARWNDII